MSDDHAITNTADRLAPEASSRTPWVILILGVWFAAVAMLAGRGAFQAPDGVPPVALLVAATAPAALFWLAWRASAGLRAWVAGLDLALVTAAQAWRVVGASFLFLWALGLLPGTFAAPAGFGDVAVGLFAAGVAVSVARRTGRWRRDAYLLIWVGMADFVAAIGTAILSDPGGPLALAGGPTADLMEQLPMVLIPAFAVPVFIILHLIAWLKLRTED